MPAPDAEPQVAEPTPAVQDGAEAALGKAIPQLRKILGPAEQTARGMLEAEDALHLLRERFERTEDPEVQGELAAEALVHVERQLELTHERRRQLDGIEAKLWGRQNRLEGFLVHTRKRLVARTPQATATGDSRPADMTWSAPAAVANVMQRIVSSDRVRASSPISPGPVRSSLPSSTVKP